MGYFKPTSPQIAKRNKLLGAYCQELDNLRGKYGYIVVQRQGDGEHEWRAGARVPHVKRMRMVKLMKLIDFLLRGKKGPRYLVFAPSLERRHWRCAFASPYYCGVHKFRTHYSDKVQLRES